MRVLAPPQLAMMKLRPAFFLQTVPRCVCCGWRSLGNVVRAALVCAPFVAGTGGFYHGATYNSGFDVLTGVGFALSGFCYMAAFWAWFMYVLCPSHTREEIDAQIDGK